MIICKSPVRIDFGGGGTDIEPYSSEFGGLVINATINKFVRTIACKRDDSIIKIISNDFNTIIQKESINELTYDTSLDLIKAIIKRLNPSFGIDLFTRSDVPPKSGLGASASISTSVIGAISYLMNKRLSDHEIAELGFIVEREDLSNIGGRQDQYASVFGGFNQIEFLGDSNVKVSKLNLSSSFIKRLNNNLVLAYTGKPHTSGNVLEGRVKRYNNDKSTAVKYLNMIKEIAINEREALLNEDLELFGELLTKDWELKTKLNPLVTTDFMRMLNKIAINNGAIGARFTGAGGGGCMIWLCKDGFKEKVSDALRSNGAKIIDYSFHNKGYEVIKF